MLHKQVKGMIQRASQPLCAARDAVLTADLGGNGLNGYVTISAVAELHVLPCCLTDRQPGLHQISHVQALCKGHGYCSNAMQCCEQAVCQRSGRPHCNSIMIWAW